MPTNKELIEQLQALGVQNINPNATKAVLEKMLKEASSSEISPNTANLTQTDSATVTIKTDTDKIMEAISGLAQSVDTINRRVTRIERGGKDDFKNDVSQSDIDKAAESKKSVDPRVVAILEETLGIDFGVDIETNKNSPGFKLTILVPQRLSPVKMSRRPILDTSTGKYQVNLNTGMVIEEEYWPGDRRSRTIGSTDSFDLIREHCIKVRSNIVTYYEKLHQPLPEFKLR